MSAVLTVFRAGKLELNIEPMLHHELVHRGLVRDGLSLPSGAGWMGGGGVTAGRRFNEVIRYIMLSMRDVRTAAQERAAPDGVRYSMKIDDELRQGIYTK